LASAEALWRAISGHLPTEAATNEIPGYLPVESVRGLTKRIERLALARTTVRLTAKDLIPTMSEIFCKGILRKKHLTVAVARDNRLVLRDADGNAIPALVCKTRRDLPAGEYRHEMYALVAEKVPGLTYSRGGSQAKVYVEGKKNLVTTDMALVVIQAETGFFRYEGYPTYLALVVEDVSFPIMDAKMDPSVAPTMVGSVGSPENMFAAPEKPGIASMAGYIAARTAMVPAAMRAIATRAIGTNYVTAASEWTMAVVAEMAKGNMWYADESEATRFYTELAEDIVNAGDLATVGKLSAVQGVGLPTPDMQHVWGAIIQGCYDGESYSKTIKAILKDKPALPHMADEVAAMKDAGEELDITEPDDWLMDECFQGYLDKIIAEEPLEEEVEEMYGLDTGTTGYLADVLGIDVGVPATGLQMAVEEEETEYVETRQAESDKSVSRAVLGSLAAMVAQGSIADAEARVAAGLPYMPMLPQDLLRCATGQDALLSASVFSNMTIYLQMLNHSAYKGKVQEAMTAHVKKHAAMGLVAYRINTGYRVREMRPKPAEAVKDLIRGTITRSIHAATPSVPRVDRFVFASTTTGLRWSVSVARK
jgi:hypothetical protein